MRGNTINFVSNNPGAIHPLNPPPRPRYFTPKSSAAFS